MIAVGVMLLLATLSIGNAWPVHPTKWGLRDLFSTIPCGIAILLIVAGLIKWLWLVAP